MRIPLTVATILLSSLVECLLVISQPVAAAPVRPVGLDVSCARHLATRVTDGDGPPRVLGCDPRGRGRAVIALGDPATAADVAVLVPGSDIDLHTLDDPRRPQHRPMGWAHALHRATGPDTAVVLWVGYPTPQGLGLDAATGRLARAAVPALVDEVASLRHRPGPEPHLTVIGHSYGSVVVALAASRLDADDIVLLGSPGARAHDVAALHTRARVEVARTAGDWIAHVPHLRLGDLGHGTDPVSPAFGAIRLPAGGTQGHEGYFRPGSRSLASIAGVVTGASAGTAR
jgi:hypothetical protein